MKVFAMSQIKDRVDAYTLLSMAARWEWGLPILPKQARTEDGKPYFPGCPQYQFNLSHSHPYALCALDSRPVGADIQVVKTDWRSALPNRVCTEQELAWLDEQDDRWSSFALLWALKEARVKYTGTGLRVGIQSITVPLPKSGQTLYALDGLWFRIYRGSDWMAAVCGETPAPEAPVWM